MNPVIFYKSYCPFSIKGRELLHSHFKHVKEVKCDDKTFWQDFKKDMEKHGRTIETTPVIFINGVYIGNEKALKRMLKSEVD